MHFWQSQDSLAILQWIWRAFAIFGWLFLLAKVAGQRTIGQLHAFDLMIAIAFAGTSAGALGSAKNGLPAVFATTGTIALLNLLVTYLALKSSRFRRLLQGQPLVLVQNGRLIEGTMRKARFNLDDLLLELRQKNVPNIHDVEFAILEADGKLSVIPKSQARPLQPMDLQIPTSYEGMPIVLIQDGEIIEANLVRNGLDQAWLDQELRNHGIDDQKMVLIALLDTNGRLFVGKKGQEYVTEIGSGGKARS